MSELTRSPYDPLLQVQKDAYRCGKCMQCKWIDHNEITDTDFMALCPSGARFRYEAYYASGRQEIARGLLDGTLEPSESLMHILFTCTECGGCQAICTELGDKNPLKTIVALRERMFRDELAPVPEHETLIKSMENYENPWQQPRARRDAWMRRLHLPDPRKEKVDALYFVGCTAAYDPKLQGIARTTAEILQQAGVSFGVLGKDELCCGSTLLRIGDFDAYESVARKNLDLLNSLGVGTVVTACSGCNSVLREEYPEMGGFEPEVMHVLEMVDDLIECGKLKLKKPVKMKVTYHDPCHLGRYTGVYDAPRRILEAIPGIELVEMPRNRANAFCCGAGAGVRTAFPEFARWVASERMREAASTGATALVTACPFCEQNLGEVKRQKVGVIDILELVRQSIG
ncbi:MAG: (Fe-S)-binding protein [Actinomycetota bacterium]